MRKRRWDFKRDDGPAQIEIEDHFLIFQFFIDQISYVHLVKFIVRIDDFDIHVLKISDHQVKFIENQSSELILTK